MASFDTTLPGKGGVASLLQDGGRKTSCTLGLCGQLARSGSPSSPAGLNTEEAGTPLLPSASSPLWKEGSALVPPLLQNQSPRFLLGFPDTTLVVELSASLQPGKGGSQGSTPARAGRGGRGTVFSLCVWLGQGGHCQSLCLTVCLSSSPWTRERRLSSGHLFGGSLSIGFSGFLVSSVTNLVCRRQKENPGNSPPCCSTASKVPQSTFFYHSFSVFQWLFQGLLIFVFYIMSKLFSFT